MTMNALPPTFCWTKMGTEAGEELAVIIRRKEWERQLGNGFFFWGIGQSLGENARVATRNEEFLQAIFSPMLSKAKAIDVEPNKVVVWNAWIDPQGQVRPLPIHCFVTSRAFLPSGRKKERHYALVCFSNQELNTQCDEISIFPSHLRNLSTNKPLGASQVTAIVRTSKWTDAICEAKSYSVILMAELRSPYCVQLAEPLVLNTSEVAEVSAISVSGDIESWNFLIRRLRSRIVEQAEWVQNSLCLPEALYQPSLTSFANLSAEQRLVSS